jgi:hypothetical protein
MNELEFIDLQIKLLTDRREKLLMKQKLNKPPVIIQSVGRGDAPTTNPIDCKAVVGATGESLKDEADNHHNYKRVDCCGRRIFKCDCDLYDLRKYTPTNH